MQRRIASPVALAAVVLALWAGQGACARDHSFLASTSSTSSGSGGGSSSGSMSSGGGSGGFGAGGSNAGGEPPGPSRLTILNAVVDEDAVRLCFVPYPAGDPTVEPWPGSAGLDYGEARVIEASDHVIPTDVDVLVSVVGGDLSQTAGKTCDELVAESHTTGSGGSGGAAQGAGGSGSGGAGGVGGVGGVATGGAGGAGGAGGGPPGPPFAVITLGVVPANVFTTKRSLLFAATGCLGGAGHDDPNAALVCGAGYSPTAPTARLAAMPLSRRTSADHVGLQVAHASVAAPDLLVEISNDKNGVQELLAEALPFGGALPQTPYIGFDTAAISNSGQIVAYPTNGGVALATTSFGKALTKGNVTAFANGHAYAFVAIGPTPQFGSGAWWHGFTWVTVRGDP